MTIFIAGLIGLAIGACVGFGVGFAQGICSIGSMLVKREGKR